MHLLAFGFGSGRMRGAPGTAGTLACIPFYLLLQSLSLEHYLAVVLGLLVIGVPVCERTTRDLGVHDHPGIVFDEMVAFLLVMTAAPAGWGWIATGVVLFRIFDILKPWPIGWVDRRVEGGLGIMLDDVLAAVYSWILLQTAAALLRV